MVVDVSETAVERTRPKVRIVLGPDGAVFYDPKNAENLTEEEITLVRWLARGFYGDHPTEPGTSWTVDQSANGHVDVERYRVVARDAHQIALEYGLEEKVAGATGYEGTRGGSLVYDTALIVPLKATFQTEARRQVGAVLRDDAHVGDADAQVGTAREMRRSDDNGMLAEQRCWPRRFPRWALRSPIPNTRCARSRSTSTCTSRRYAWGPARERPAGVNGAPGADGRFPADRGDFDPRHGSAHDARLDRRPRNIIGITNNARLVIDVAETAVKRTRPKVRVEVATDGVVFYDPKNAENLTEEELALVRCTARAQLLRRSPEPIPGTAWTVDQSSNGFTDVERYRVVARDAHQVTLE